MPKVTNAKFLLEDLQISEKAAAFASFSVQIGTLNYLANKRKFVPFKTSKLLPA